MNTVIERVDAELVRNKLSFTKKPLLIGGMAMEYYGMRKSGADIDLIITDEDYQRLAAKFPDNRKDIWGDMGVVIGIFEIWRSITLLDYDYYKIDAIDEGSVMVVSLDRLLLMRVFAMDAEKYMNDLRLMKKHYYEKFANQKFNAELLTHLESYRKFDGIVWGGKYDQSCV